MPLLFGVGMDLVGAMIKQWVNNLSAKLTLVILESSVLREYLDT